MKQVTRHEERRYERVEDRGACKMTAIFGRGGESMGNAVGRALAAGVSALVLAGLLAGPAGAAGKALNLSEKHLGGPVKTDDQLYEVGREGYIFYSMAEAGLDRNRGSLELRLRRTGRIGDSTAGNYNPLVEFETSKGENVFNIYIQWEDQYRPGGSALDVGGPTHRKPNELVWGLRNEFGPAPEVGRRGAGGAHLGTHGGGEPDLRRREGDRRLRPPLWRGHLPPEGEALGGPQGRGSHEDPRQRAGGRAAREVPGLRPGHRDPRCQGARRGHAGRAGPPRSPPSTTTPPRWPGSPAGWWPAT